MHCPNCGKRVAPEAHFCLDCGFQLRMGVVQTTDKKDYDIKTEFEYAGFWQRFVAYIIDYVFLFIVGLILVFVLDIAIRHPDYSDSSFNFYDLIPALIVTWIYYSLMESSAAQATLGKQALKLIVVDVNGKRISFGKATGRFWGKILSTFILLIGFFMIALTKKKQGLHDILSGCLVIVNR